VGLALAGIELEGVVMPGWVIPALKVILPHVGTIVQAAKPAFTRRSSGERGAPDEEIGELQAAVTQNADHIKALAEQLQKTVAVLEEEAERTRAKLRRAYVACGASVATAGVALVTAVVALLSR
jgi:hypothetical protein